MIYSQFQCLFLIVHQWKIFGFIFKLVAHSFLLRCELFMHFSTLIFFPINSLLSHSVIIIIDIEKSKTHQIGDIHSSIKKNAVHQHIFESVMNFKIYQISQLVFKQKKSFTSFATSPVRRGITSLEFENYFISSLGRALVRLLILCVW